MNRERHRQGIGWLAALLVTALPVAPASSAPPVDASADHPVIALEALTRIEREARALYLAGDHAGALALLLSVDARVRAAGDNPPFRWAVARCYTHLEQWPEALAAWQAFVAIAPDDARRARGEAELAAVRRRALGRLAVRCPPSDGAEVALSAKGPFAPCPADFGEVAAGPRTVYLRAGSRRWTHEVAVRGGVRTVAEVSAPARPAVAVTAESPPLAAGGLQLRGLMAVNVGGLAGVLRGWSLQPGPGLSLGAGLDYPVSSAVDVSLTGLWHRQTQAWVWQMETERADAYDVTLDSLELQMLGRLHLLGRSGPGLYALAGAGLEYLLHSDARGGSGTTALDFSPVQGTASAGVGTILLEAVGLTLRLDARAAIGMTPATAGDARLYRVGLASNVVF